MTGLATGVCFSALQRAENSSMLDNRRASVGKRNEFQCSSASRKFLNGSTTLRRCKRASVSVLFNEPKLLKCIAWARWLLPSSGFSALQRAEIAEISSSIQGRSIRAGFSALQRAEIAEISGSRGCENKTASFSALQRAEIAEILARRAIATLRNAFQCSSTSRNC